MLAPSDRVGIVHVGLELQDDLGLRRAGGEEEAVVVGVGDWPRPVVVVLVVEVGKGEERYDVGAGENTTWGQDDPRLGFGCPMGGSCSSILPNTNEHVYAGYKMPDKSF